LNNYLQSPHRFKGKLRLFATVLVLLAAILACNAPGLGGSAEVITATPPPTLTPTATPEDGEGSGEEEEDSDMGQGMDEDMFEETMDDVQSSGSGLNAGFVSDITIEDGSKYNPDSAIRKTWRITNNGSSAWPQGTQLVFTRGAQMSGPSAVNVPIAQPGGTVDISVDIVTPSASGAYRGFWQMRSPNGQLFGTEFFVDLVVLSGGSNENTNTNQNSNQNTNDNSSGGPADLLISELGYNTDRFYQQEEFSMRVVIKNDGGTASGGFEVYLDIEDGDDLDQDFPSIEPGQTAEYTFKLEFANDGNFDVEIRVDNDDDVTEGNEDNNSRDEELEIRAATLVKFGTFDLAPNTCAEFDSVGGQTACNGSADVEWQVDDDNDDDESNDTRTWDAANGAEYRGVGTFRPSIEVCREANKSGSDIDASPGDNDLPDGTYLCVETSSGNIGWVYIRDYGETLDIEFRVWDIG